MARKTVSFRFPENIVQALEVTAKATGKHKTTLIIEILSRAYGLPQPPPQQITLEMLQQQIDQLKQQVAVLEIGVASASTGVEHSGTAPELNRQNLIPNTRVGGGEDSLVKQFAAGPFVT